MRGGGGGGAGGCRSRGAEGVGEAPGPLAGRCLSPSLETRMAALPAGYISTKMCPAPLPLCSVVEWFCAASVAGSEPLTLKKRNA